MNQSKLLPIIGQAAALVANKGSLDGSEKIRIAPDADQIRGDPKRITFISGLPGEMEPAPLWGELI